MTFRPFRAARLLLALVLVPVAFALPAQAASYDTKANSAILLDLAANRVLFEKDADKRIPTASMSKVMTMYVVFERLRDGRLSMDDELLVSKNAWQKEGSKMFVEIDKRVKVSDLIKGVIVQSGNDAAIVLAEGIAGTEEAFAVQMNQTAQRLGLTGSHFDNATGLPSPTHYSTVRDLAKLSQALIHDFPEYYNIYSEQEFTYNEIRQANRNPLLGTEGNRNSLVQGADGIKTGHTQEAGYGLMGSAVRDGRRLIMVISGLGSMRERADESNRLMEWGFREFSAYTLFKAGDRATEVDVWMGDKPKVPLLVTQDVVLTLSPGEVEQLQVRARVEAPVPAPVEARQELGTLVVEIPGGTEPLTLPLVAANAVGELGMTSRFLAGMQSVLFGQEDPAAAPTVAVPQ